ncbi:hypothetical protein [Roseibacillus persicicus]|uniref:hypothetical protein n=1 Tax=Roseibacillus persicicus TaxID=454148 RepID=UPI00280F9985|nr:hypothetical protein [Roseibacillus persicicus]MDQ8189254.1 hypothetical protein [Roseibacillus persicicus]
MPADTTKSFRSLDEDRFVEQAEYLSSKLLAQLNAQHPDEKAILQKLSGPGAKLVIGPRGCGKTTLLLRAKSAMLADSSLKSLPVYVNYKVSLRLEPVYAKRANASFLFKQWLIAKILIGLHETLEKFNEVSSEELLTHSRSTLEELLLLIEKGDGDSDFEDNLAVSSVEENARRAISVLGAKRCSLLLDDAAHAFSAQQQRDFFELFRELKSQVICPKAAIYPGVTVFPPGFQLGHDAEPIDVWIDPFSKSYLPFVKDLVKRRVSPKVYSVLEANSALFGLLCYSAFGMPRAILNVIRELTKGSSDFKFEARPAYKAISESYHSNHSVYESLSLKLPSYAPFIKTGSTALRKAAGYIKNYNKGKGSSEQSVTIAIKDDAPAEVIRMFGFYQYAGLVRENGKVSRGEKGVFLLYRLHIGGLVDTNCLFGRKAVNAEDYVFALNHQRSHSFTRVGVDKLLDNIPARLALALALPDCETCGASRSSEEAKFCSNCGTPVSPSSVFNSLVSQPISKLPLTHHRVKTIRDGSSIRTIKDIFLDIDRTTLRGVHMIGPYWADRIHSYAEEYIS